MARPTHPYADLPFAALAHRGGALLPANLGRENTLAAFRVAYDLGYRCLETDARCSRDGQVVLFHDDETTRLTGQPGQIEQRSTAEIAALAVGGEAIPSLDELLEAFPDCRLNLDLKGPGTAQPVATVLARHQAFDRVLVNSFSPRRLSLFRSLTRGRAATGVSLPGIAWTRFVPLLPCLVNSPGAVLQIPRRQTVGPVVLTICQRSLITQAHAAGRAVHVWTVDDEATMTELIEAGVDGLITDRPDILKTVLETRGLWAGQP